MPTWIFVVGILVCWVYCVYMSQFAGPGPCGRCEHEKACDACEHTAAIACEGCRRHMSVGEKVSSICSIGVGVLSLAALISLG